MKLPNFRLYSTQATASMILGLLGLVCALMLAFFVFHGFDAKHTAVVYDPEGSLGQFRKPLVFVTSLVGGGVGLVAGILGFRSLGQRRNTKQGHSWLGMTLGALAMALAPVLLFTWLRIAEAVIKDRG